MNNYQVTIRTNLNRTIVYVIGQEKDNLKAVKRAVNAFNHECKGAGEIEEIRVKQI